MNVRCPKCAEFLPNFPAEGYCQKCGRHIRVPVPADSSAPSDSEPSRWWGLLALVIGHAVYKATDNFLLAFEVVVAGILLLELLRFLARYTWRQAAKASRKLADEGLYGVAKTVNEKIVTPVLYGRKGKPD
jgi:hypothetical protein